MCKSALILEQFKQLAKQMRNYCQLIHKKNKVNKLGQLKVRK